MGEDIASPGDGDVCSSRAIMSAAVVTTGDVVEEEDKEADDDKSQNCAPGSVSSLAQLLSFSSPGSVSSLTADDVATIEIVVVGAAGAIVTPCDRGPILLAVVVVVVHKGVVLVPLSVVVLISLLTSIGPVAPQLYLFGITQLLPKRSSIVMRETCLHTSSSILCSVFLFSSS